MAESGLLNRVSTELRTKHYSRKTEESYISWIKQYIIYNKKIHPGKMGKEEVRKFLNHLAVERNVSASTQNQLRRIKKGSCQGFLCNLARNARFLV